VIYGACKHLRIGGRVREPDGPRRGRQQGARGGLPEDGRVFARPIEELHHALGLKDTKLPWIVLGGGLTGAAAGYGLQYWASTIAYPFNIGGRPLHSWPSFIVPAFETTILFSAAAAVLGMILLNGLPMPYHPIFNAARFAMASRDRFFLCIESKDPNSTRRPRGASSKASARGR